MRRFLRLAALLGGSFPLAAALAATAWAVRPAQRGGYRARFLGAWSRFTCLLLNIRVDVAGTLPASGGRLAVSNHLGYLDIPVLGSVLAGSFVAKSEVARWPVIGTLSRLVGMVYVDRGKRAAAGKHRIAIGAPIPCGDADRKRLAIAARERVVSLGGCRPHPGTSPNRGFPWFFPVSSRL